MPATLRQAFDAFGHPHMDKAHFVAACEAAGFIARGTFTKRDAEDCFDRAKPAGSVRLTFGAFQNSAIPTIAAARHTDPATISKALCAVAPELPAEARRASAPAAEAPAPRRSSERAPERHEPQGLTSAMARVDIGGQALAGGAVVHDTHHAGGRAVGGEQPSQGAPAPERTGPLPSLQATFDAFAQGQMDVKKFVAMLRRAGICSSAGQPATVGRGLAPSDAESIFGAAVPAGAIRISFMAFERQVMPSLASRLGLAAPQVSHAIRAAAPQTAETRAGPNPARFHDDKNTFTGVYTHGGPSHVDTPGGLRTLVDRDNACDIRGAVRNYR